MLNRFPLVSLCFALVLGGTLSCSKQAAASGDRGTRLALSQPANQTITQGESNKVAVAIERTAFAAPVAITFTNLPVGITVTGDTIPSGESKWDFVFVASPDAPIAAKKMVTVTAKGADITLTQTFELTVKARS